MLRIAENDCSELFNIEWNGRESEEILAAMKKMVDVLRDSGLAGRVVIGHYIVFHDDGSTESTFGIGIPSLLIGDFSSDSLRDSFSSVLSKFRRHRKLLNGALHLILGLLPTALLLLD